MKIILLNFILQYFLEHFVKKKERNKDKNKQGRFDIMKKDLPDIIQHKVFKENVYEDRCV